MEQTDLFIFVFLFYFVHVACMTTVIAQKSMKTNHKIFLIVAKNRLLLAAVYVGDDLAANRRHQMLLLFCLDIVHIENISYKSVGSHLLESVHSFSASTVLVA